MKFNVVAVESPSEESGVSIPDKGIWKNTAVLSNYDTFYSDRYLTTLHLKTLHNWLAGIPYEHIIVLVNTDRYGGGGVLNSYDLCAAHHPRSDQCWCMNSGTASPDSPTSTLTSKRPYHCIHTTWSHGRKT